MYASFPYFPFTILLTASFYSLAPFFHQTAFTEMTKFPVANYNRCLLALDFQGCKMQHGAYYLHLEMLSWSCGIFWFSSSSLATLLCSLLASLSTESFKYRYSSEFSPWLLLSHATHFLSFVSYSYSSRWHFYICHSHVQPKFLSWV